MDEKQNAVYYRRRIMNMVQKIEDPAILKLIYGLAKSGYNEEKAGRVS